MQKLHVAGVFVVVLTCCSALFFSGYILLKHNNDSSSPSSSSFSNGAAHGDRVPPPNYGLEYEGRSFGFSADMLVRSRANVGGVQRLRKLLGRLHDGLPVRGVALGGSITDGNGLNRGDPRSKSWVYGKRFESWIRHSYPVRDSDANHTMDIIAFQACGTCFTVKQLNQLFRQQRRPEELDLVVVEFAQNEGHGQFNKETGFSPGYREVVQCTEALIRFFLELNPHVCVIYLEAWYYKQTNAQTLHQIVTVPYNIPVLSAENGIPEAPTVVGTAGQGRECVHAVVV